MAQVAASGKIDGNGEGEDGAHDDAMARMVHGRSNIVEDMHPFQDNHVVDERAVGAGHALKQ